MGESCLFGHEVLADSIVVEDLGHVNIKEVVMGILSVKAQSLELVSIALQSIGGWGIKSSVAYIRTNRPECLVYGHVSVGLV